MARSKKNEGSRNNSRWGRSTKRSKKVESERRQGSKSSRRNEKSRGENVKR